VEYNTPDSEIPTEFVAAASVEDEGSLQGCSSETDDQHEDNQLRFTLSQKTGLLTDLLPPASISQLASILRVVNLEHK
jgi:hypothetical protein